MGPSLLFPPTFFEKKFFFFRKVIVALRNPRSPHVLINRQTNLPSKLQICWLTNVRGRIICIMLHSIFTPKRHTHFCKTLPLRVNSNNENCLLCTKNNTVCILFSNCHPHYKHKSNVLEICRKKEQYIGPFPIKSYHYWAHLC